MTMFFGYHPDAYWEVKESILDDSQPDLPLESIDLGALFSDLQGDLGGQKAEGTTSDKGGEKERDDNSSFLDMCDPIDTIHEDHEVEKLPDLELATSMEQQSEAFWAQEEEEEKQLELARRKKREEEQKLEDVFFRNLQMNMADDSFREGGNAGPQIYDVWRANGCACRACCFTHSLPVVDMPEHAYIIAPCDVLVNKHWRCILQSRQHLSHWTKS